MTRDVENEIFVAMLDVESVGLDGRAFAWAVTVGSVFTNQPGYRSFRIHKEFGCFRKPLPQDGSPADHEWVRNNVPELTDLEEVQTHEALKASFVDCYNSMPRLFPGVVWAADCPYPVETGFLCDCNLKPYPLWDVESVSLAVGIPPCTYAERLPSELPQHHPLRDARQSLRLLAESVASIRRGRR